MLGEVAPSEELQTYKETMTELEREQINALVELAEKGELTSKDIQKL